MKTYWISMAAKGKSRTVLVDAESSTQAKAKIHELGLYQSGDEFYVVAIPPTELEYTLPRNRVLTEAELRAVGAATLGEIGDEMERIAESIGAFSGPDESN